MCDASKGEKDAAAQQKTFTDTMVSQASQVFGNDNTVFNNLMKTYQGTVAAGPNQQGFSQAELNAKDASVINRNAEQFKNVSGAVAGRRSTAGGGNTVDNSGATTNADLGIAEAAASSTASGLNAVQQQDYEVGRENYQFAAKGEQMAPSSFDNMPGMNSTVQKGMDANMTNQKSLSASANWWVKPVMGLASDVAGVATGGLSELATNAADNHNG